MNMHENYMPDLIFALPELKTKQNNEFLTLFMKNEKYRKIENVEKNQV